MTGSRWRDTPVDLSRALARNTCGSESCVGTKHLSFRGATASRYTCHSEERLRRDVGINQEILTPRQGSSQNDRGIRQGSFQNNIGLQKDLFRGGNYLALQHIELAVQFNYCLKNIE